MSSDHPSHRRPGTHLHAVPPPHDEQGPDGTLPPPHDPQAEQAVLGSLILRPDLIDEVLDLVTAPEFYRPAHELIYQAITTTHLEGNPVDTITIADHLQTTGNLQRAGGHAYLHQLVDNVSVAANAPYYADIVADTAARRRLVEAGTRITQLGYTATADVDAALTLAAEHIANIPRPTTTPGAGNTWAPVDLQDILTNGEELQQPTHMHRTDGQALLYPAAVHSISGEPESGKTWVALIAAAQTLRDTQDDVTYIDFEDRAGRVIPRLLQLGAPRPAILHRFHYIRPTAALDPAGRTHLDHAAQSSSLAIIDGVTEAMTMHGLSLMDNEDAARYLDLLPRHLADQGCAVLQIDHVVKDAERQGRWAIGAGHKLAGLDGAAYGVKVTEPFGRGKTGRAIISVHKDRPGAVREIALGNAVAHLIIDSTQEGHMRAHLEPPAEMPRGQDGHERPTHLMEKVSRYVEITPGISGKQIEDALGGKRDYVRKAIRALVLEEFLATEQGTRGATLHRSLIPFRMEDHGDA